MKAEHHDDTRAAWAEFARAAEQFARAVADDARRFASGVEHHAGEFAQTVARDWSDAWRAAPEPQRIFSDVRKILAGVTAVVDDLIGGLFADARSASWTRVVSNRDATCSACGAAIAAATEAHVRRTAAGTDYRCVACGSGPAS